MLKDDIEWLRFRIDQRSDPRPAELPTAKLSQLSYNMNCQDDADTWHERVRHVINRIGAGVLEKAVLARTCDAIANQPFRPTDILKRLENRYPDCYRFLVEPVLGHAFLGATPEMLVEVRESVLYTDALAGSIGRGKNSKEDDQLGDQLLASAKDRQEHNFVVQAIANALRELARTLDVPGTPGLRRLRNIQHLHTPICGRLDRGVDILAVVQALHPTPAVGGVPKEPAMNTISELETVERGWYAGPVGWMTPDGDGIFNVAIRSAVTIGNRVRLYAGAGIVADSEPTAEWEETGLKLQPMLESLAASARE